MEEQPVRSKDDQSSRDQEKFHVSSTVTLDIQYAVLKSIGEWVNNWQMQVEQKKEENGNHEAATSSEISLSTVKKTNLSWAGPSIAKVGVIDGIIIC